MRRRTSETVDFDGKGGKNRITKAGKYAFVVHPGENGIESETEARFELEVVGPTDSDQLGKTAGFRLEFEASDPQYQDVVDRKIAAATIALQLVEGISGKVATRENWNAWKGQEVEFNFEEADGRQFTAEVKMREFDEKDKETGQPTGRKLQTPDIMWWTMVAANGGPSVPAKPAATPAAPPTAPAEPAAAADPWASLV